MVAPVGKMALPAHTERTSIDYRVSVLSRPPPLIKMHFALKLFLLMLALAGKVMISVMTVRFSVRLFPLYFLNRLIFDFFACTWVVIVARWGLKVKDKSEGQGLGLRLAMQSV